MSNFLSSLLKGGAKRRSVRSRSPRGKSMYPKKVALEKRWVWEGRLPHTRSGLTKADLTVSRSGQIVSKLKSQHSKKLMASLKRRGLAAPPFKRRSRR